MIVRWENDDMSHYYASIELGCDSIKILVCNKTDNSYYVISKVSLPSEGMTKGIIVDAKKAVNSIKKTLKKINEMLGFKINQVILAIPTMNCKMTILTGSCKVINSKEIVGEDITNVLKNALTGKIGDKEEVITAIPISFNTSEEENIKDPKGLASENLEVKVLVTTSPKDYVYRLLEIVRQSGLETVDVCYCATGDYYEVRNSKMEKQIGAIVNIGEEETSISVFNKGIMIKNKIINIGSKNIDKDITYIYKTPLDVSRGLKENFVVASSRYADTNDNVKVQTQEKKAIEITQLELSKVVEARCREILKIAKKELNNLTKKEIRYIIITGGVSELAGFQYVVEDILGIKARICNITTMGVRHNKYSSVLGVIKYFDNKLALRGAEVNMLSDTSINRLLSIKENKDNNNDNIINKVFGRFFEN